MTIPSNFDEVKGVEWRHASKGMQSNNLKLTNLESLSLFFYSLKRVSPRHTFLIYKIHCGRKTFNMISLLTPSNLQVLNSLQTTTARLLVCCVPRAWKYLSKFSIL